MTNSPLISNNKTSITKVLKQDGALYMLIFPAFCFTLIFAYIPLFGLIMAFKDYDIMKGFFESPWAANFGLQHIIDIFQTEELYGSVLNTLMLSVLNLLIGFPAPIILALLLNELRIHSFKRVVQTISYMPYFLSWISVIGLCYAFFSDYGPLNDILNLIYGEDRQRVLYLTKQQLFVPMQVFLNLWKSVGWGSIIYLASISAIDPQLYEAASMDGASRFQQAWNITIPGISTTAIVLLILSIGSIMGSNFELVFGLQNAYIDFETIDTVIYKSGIQQRGYSLATALGFTRGMIALVLTLIINFISKKYNNTSVF